MRYVKTTPIPQIREQPMLHEPLFWYTTDSESCSHQARLRGPETPVSNFIACYSMNHPRCTFVALFLRSSGLRALQNLPRGGPGLGNY